MCLVRPAIVPPNASAIRTYLSSTHKCCLENCMIEKAKYVHMHITKEVLC